MPTNTTRGSFRKIALSDAADISLVTGDLGDDIDAKILLWAAGTDALKPAASLDGKTYHSTDTDRLSYDMGSSWRKILMQTASGDYKADNPVDATGFKVSGTLLAASHLSDGVSGTGAIAKVGGPTFTGIPLASTAAVDTNTTQIATTAYVVGQGYAKLASPTLTGTPAAPTAAADTNTTQLATTAYVVGQAGSATPGMNGSAAVGTSLRYSRQDHIHPTDTSRAPLASPGLTGTPTTPTAAADTNTTQIASTAYVVGQAGSATPLQASGSGTPGTSLRYARQDHVHPTPVIPHVERGSVDYGGPGVTDVSVTFTSAFSSTSGLGVGSSAVSDPGGVPVSATQNLTTTGFTMHPSGWYSTDHGTGYYVASGP